MGFEAEGPVRLFQVVFCLGLSFVTVHEILLGFKTEALSQETHKLLGKWVIPKVEGRAFLMLAGALVLALIINVYYYHAPLTLVLCAILYFPVYGQMPLLGRKSNLYPLVLLIMAVVPDVPEVMISSGEPWPMVFVKTLLSIVYLSSFIQKMRYTARPWLNGEKLRSVIAYHDLLYGSHFRTLFDKVRVSYRLMSLTILVFEAFFWTSVIFSDYSLWYGVTAILFHLATLVFLRINYLKYYLPVLMAYLV